MQNLTPFFVTVDEAKRLLAVGHTRIYELMKAGEIERVKSGAKSLVTYESLSRYAASLREREVA